MHTTIIGRSSSHFSRVVRIFAAELNVEYAYEVVRDLTSREPSVYAGNPALKIPVLRNEQGVWFGAQPICRELHRQSQRNLRILWPEQLMDNAASNTQELVLHAMSTGVNLIMSKISGSAAHPKLDISLDNSLQWLESNVTSVVGRLPAHDLSFLEVSLFCLLTHLEFREIRKLDNYASLRKFCETFGQRASAQATPFQYDT
jgi:glutathione S-transferase